MKGAHIRSRVLYLREADGADRASTADGRKPLWQTVVVLMFNSVEATEDP